MSFDIAEALFRDWMHFCRQIDRVDAIDIGPRFEDAYLLGVCSGVSTSFGLEMNRELAETGHWQLRWRRYGYPTFNLTHSLAAALLLTDCSAVKGSEFRFPFPSFLITLPYPKSPLVIDGAEGPGGVRWIMVNTMDCPQTKDAEKMDAWLSSGGWKKGSCKEVNPLPLTMVRLIENEGVGVFERKPFPKDDDTLESWLMASHPIEAVHHLETTSLDNAAAMAGLRLVANLCLYLDAQKQAGLDLPARGNPKRKKSHRRPRQSGPVIPPAWVLGTDIKLSPELRAAAAQSARPKSQQRPEWKLQSQHVVRGHWKMQRHGPQRSLRKKIRVEPYWRGPRLSEAVLRSFTEK